MSDTETAAARYQGIEGWPVAEALAAMIEGQMAAVATLQAAAPALERAITAAAERLGDTGRLIYTGAGTSGRIAAQDAAELAPTFGWPRARALVLMAGGDAAYARAVEGAEDDAAAARAGMAGLGVGPADVVIALAASGRTPFTLGAVQAARAAGALSIGIANNPASALATACDHAVTLPTGPEIIAGSTRMKAGTAQRAALTCLSTGIFLRLGHVWRGRMVAMVAGNDKLRARARAMVADLTGLPEDQSAQALDRAGGDIRLALTMLTTGLDAEPADHALARAGGRLDRVHAGWKARDQ